VTVALCAGRVEQQRNSCGLRATASQRRREIRPDETRVLRGEVAGQNLRPSEEDLGYPFHMGMSVTLTCCWSALLPMTLTSGPRLGISRCTRVITLVIEITAFLSRTFR
jgi:hypothetical protein